MATRIAFLVRWPRILPIVLSVICLLAPAEAQRGGGGGHSGGGHFAGGHFGGGHASSRHSSGSHGGGHFGWLHFWSGKQSARDAGSGASSISDISPHGPSRNFATPARTSSFSRVPSTLLWSPPQFPRRLDRQVLLVSSPVRLHRGFFFKHFPRFSSSGCFFNGVTQVCFFEPFLPLLCFSGEFDLFYSGFGFDGDSLDQGNDVKSQGPMQPEMSAIPPTANPSDEDTPEENSSVRPGAMLGAGTEQEALSKGVLLLVLNNGTSHAVVDYWVADGYLEYISPDGTRSHIPLEALDLQNTVIQNAPRGLRFVLRSTPAQNR
jgi:hypothetical protein